MEHALAQQFSDQPALVFSPHPLLASANRQVSYIPINAGESILHYLQRLRLPVGGSAWALHLNDAYIPQDAWALTFPKQGDLLTLRARVHGGDNGDSNKTLRTIATIIVLAIAGQYEGAAKVAIAALGAYAAAKLFPPILPPTDQLRGEDNSPTYSITGGSNRARPFGVMPCVLGTHRIYPDIGAKTYTEFSGEDQFLYQVFHFGLTDVVLSDFRIGDTPITSYSDYTLEESDGTGALTLFPANVDTLAGAQLTEAASWISRTSSLDATALAVELSGFLFYSGSGGFESRSVTIGLEYRLVGDVTWLPFYGTGEVVISHSSRQPLRWGHRIDVASGQYEVRLRRVTPDETDSRATSDITWTQLRTYQPDTADYTGQKRVALRIRANEQLQGQVDQLSAIATLQAEVWTGSAWVVQATSNPAWLYRYWATGKAYGGRRYFGGNLTDADMDIAAIKDWGAWCDLKGLTCDLVFDRDMSLEQQLEIIANCGRGHPTRASGKLGVIWDEENQPVVAHFGMANIRSGTFSVSYASKRSFDEVVVSFINPDLNYQADTVRVLVPGVVNPVNTLNIDLMGCTNKDMAGKAANLIAAETVYRRRTITWETDMEGQVADRGDVVSLSHDLTQWGASGRLLSGTETVLTLDKPVTFSVGYDHYLRLVYPDGSEDIYPVQYQAGEAATIVLLTKIVKDLWTATTPVALNDERGPTVFNGYYYVADVPGDTGASEPVWPLVEGDTVADGTATWRNAGPAQQYTPDTNPNSTVLNYKWCFDPKATPGKKVKITDHKPIDEHYIRLTAVDEDENYYLSESNTYTYVANANAALTPTLDKLDVNDVLIPSGNGYAVRVTLAWDVSGPYGFALVRAAPNGEILKVVDRTFDRRAEILWTETGNVDLEVTVFNKNGQYGSSGKISTTYSIKGKNQAPNDVTNARYVITNTGPVLQWDDVNDADLLDYEIRDGASWNTALFVDRAKKNEHALPWLTTGTHNYLIKARDSSTNKLYSVNAATVSLTITALDQPNVTPSFEGENLILSWTTPTGTLPVKEYRVSYGSVPDETPVGSISANRFSIKAQWSGVRTWWLVPVDMAGNDGAPASADVTLLLPTISTFTRKVIDNQAALFWSVTLGTLPIKEYELYKGDVFATAELLGANTGTFDLITELAAGTYTYWVVPVDAAGNQGAAVSTVAIVNAPPDFVLREDWVSTFGGTKTNAYITQAGELLLPVNTTETLADRFTNNSWANFQDQVDAGFPFYAMPSLLSASYEETFDYGTVLEGTLISIVKNLQTIGGSATYAATISVKKLLGDAWTDYVGVEQVYATDFQYVKIKLDFTAVGGDDLLLIKQLNVQLSVKEITDAGSAIANAADSGGTVVLLNKPFVAVESITVTYQGTTSVTTAAPLPGIANPTQFVVYLFDSVTGARVSGNFSWKVRGN